MRPLDNRGLAVLVLWTTAAAARGIVGPHVTDDAYITMRYSRNLTDAGVMSYNPPDAVLGTSTPLWTWVLAAGNLVDIAPETTALGAAFLADACSIALLLLSPAGGSPASLASAATIAAWPAYVTYAVSGMETSLYVLTIVAFVTAMNRKATAAAAVVASLAALCRPDGALLVVLGIVWMTLTQSSAAGLRFVLIAATTCAPWAIYAFARFGSILPASVIAKASATDPWMLSLRNLEAYFFSGHYVVLTVLSLAGFVAIVKDRTTHGGPWVLWSVWAWSYLLGMTIVNGFTHFPWYFVPLLPIYTGAAARGLSAAAERGWQVFRKDDSHLSRGRMRPAMAALLGALLLTRMPALKAYLDHTAAGRENLYASVAAQLARQDATCTVAATEIGAIGYHYPGRILDLVGLVSPEVLGRPADVVLAESGARWLVTYDTHVDRAVVQAARFTQIFERRTRTRVSDERALEVYERRDRARCATP